MKLSSEMKKMIDKKLKGVYYNLFEIGMFSERSLQNDMAAYTNAVEEYDSRLSKARRKLQEEYAELRKTNSYLNGTYANQASQKSDLLMAVSTAGIYLSESQNLNGKREEINRCSDRLDNWKILSSERQQEFFRSQFESDSGFWSEFFSIASDDIKKMQGKGKICLVFGLCFLFVLILIYFDSIFQVFMFSSTLGTDVLQQAFLWLVGLPSAFLLWKWLSSLTKATNMKTALQDRGSLIETILDYASKQSEWQKMKKCSADRIAELQKFEQEKKVCRAESNFVQEIAPKLCNILPHGYESYYIAASEALLSGRCENYRELCNYLENKKYRDDQIAISRQMAVDQARANEELKRMNAERLRTEQERLRAEQDYYQDALEMEKAAQRERNQANERLLKEQKKANEINRKTYERTKKIADYEERNFYQK